MKKLTIFFIVLFACYQVKAQTAELTLEQFGAKSDGVVIDAGSIDAGSTTLTAKAAQFRTSDVGKIIYIAGAGKRSVTLIANISSVNSPKSVTLSVPAAMAVTDSGVTYGTDCTDAFIKFNHRARELRSSKVVLNMRPGIYLTSFNNWIAGIRDITVNGNGTHVICTHGAIQAADFPNPNVGLFSPSVFDNVDNNYYEHKSASDLSFGSKIQTVQQGSDAVTMLNAGDVQNFKVGNWILVYGLHHEDFIRFPPDPRFFEYVKIKRIDQNSGTVYIDRKLKYTYDAGWPDGVQADGVGAPRILNLNRDNFSIIENIDINNITFLPFNGWNGKLASNIRNGRFTLYGYLHAKVTNVTASGAYFGTGGTAIADHITFQYEWEPDKVMDSLIVQNSTITNFSHATGVNVLILKNNKFLGKFNASPRVLYMDGNDIACTGTNNSAMLSVAFNKGTEYMHIGTNTWECTDPNRQALFSAMGSAKLNVARVVDRNTVSVPFTQFANDKDTRQVVPGSVGYTAQGKKFEVKRVYALGNGDIAVSGDFSSPPQQGDSFVFSYADKIDITGKQIKVGPYANQYKLFQNQDKKLRLNFMSESFKQ